MILDFTHFFLQMNRALLLGEVLVMKSWSIHFEFGFYTFVFVDESSIVAKRSTGDLKPVY